MSAAEVGSDAKRVIVLGGGIAGLAAAWELTRPSLKGRFQVTVYQMGWRLGGKGRSGRNLTCANRIEEHGLHLFAGCYENAFRILRECYEELGRAPGEPLATWREAFRPRDFTVLEELHQGTWTHWPQKFPIFESEPGESDDVAGPADMLAGLVRWALRTVLGGDDAQRFSPPESADSARTAWLKPLLGELFPPLESRDSPALLRSARRLSHALGALVEGRLLPGARTRHRALAWALKRFRGVVRSYYENDLDDAERRRIFLTLDFVATNAIGVLEEGFLISPSGALSDLKFSDWLTNIQRIDDLDYRDWLKIHGAHEATVRSCILRGLGDAVFNTGRAGSAAAGLNGLVRLNLTYRGSLFYEMRAGMGEVVFAPLYEVLARRGVCFELFHRVDALHLDPTGRRLQAVELARQVRTKGTYQPLIQVPVLGGKLPCWGVVPDWSQIEGGEALEAAGIDLESPEPVPGEAHFRIDDFDAAVLAIPVGALRPLTRELSAKSAQWRAMLDSLVTTRTISAQLWMDKDVKALGWKQDPAVVTSYAEPLDTWADMTHLLGVEHWEGRAQSLSYLVGSVDDTGSDDAQNARAKDLTIEWMQQNLGHILPEAITPEGEVRYERLVASAGQVGPARLDEQYVRMNVHPADRYVLSLPGTARYRLRAEESGFERLYLAGDWVKTGMNVGSAEAAAMAGLRAAKVISGAPVRIVGDFE